MYKVDNYYRGAHCKYKLTAHIVLVTKYRRKILYGKLDNNLKTIICNLANENNWHVQTLETDEDHIYIYIYY